METQSKNLQIVMPSEDISGRCCSTAHGRKQNCIPLFRQLIMDGSLLQLAELIGIIERDAATNDDEVFVE